MTRNPISTGSPNSADRPVFRFAPSPNGELHLGHAYSALLNAQLAKETGGRLLLRIEDIDVERCTPEFEAGIDRDLEWLGIEWEEPVRRQSEHFEDYRAALNRLISADLVYPAFMSRGEIRAWIAARPDGGKDWPRDPDGAPLYPPVDKLRTASEQQRRMESGEPFAWRLDMGKVVIGIAKSLQWTELAVDTDSFVLTPTPNPSPQGGGGIQAATLAPIFNGFGGGITEAKSPLRGGVRGGGNEEKTARIASHLRPISADPSLWGDIVLARKDMPTSYNLSVVLDDALQGVTHVIRGKDLFEATAVHRLLQVLLGLPEPVYHHHRLILGPDGRKLSKSLRDTGLRALREAGTGAADIRRMVGLEE